MSLPPQLSRKLSFLHSGVWDITQLLEPTEPTFMSLMKAENLEDFFQAYKGHRFDVVNFEPKLFGPKPEDEIEDFLSQFHNYHSKMLNPAAHILYWVDCKDFRYVFTRYASNGKIFIWHHGPEQKQGADFDEFEFGFNETFKVGILTNIGQRSFLGRGVASIAIPKSPSISHIPEQVYRSLLPVIVNKQTSILDISRSGVCTKVSAEIISARSTVNLQLS